MLAQVGELASSKSTMKTLAPELNALISILASVGPVISTRRLARAGGAGATCQSPLRTSAVSGRKSGRSPARSLFHRSAPGGQDPFPAGAQPALEIGDEGERLIGQDRGIASVDRAEDLDTGGQGHGRLLPEIDASSSSTGW